MAMMSMVLFSCVNTIEEVKEIDTTTEKPVKESFNVVYYRSEKGKVTNRLISPHVKQFKNGNAVFPEGFVLEILDSNLQMSAYIRANNGKILGEEKRMIARDSVTIRNDNNEELFTEELIWQQDSAKIYTDAFVKIKKQDVVILGKGLVSNEDFSKYRIKNISGEYYLNKEEFENGKTE